MRSLHFDPFKTRLARDIRNNLSKAFLQALAEKDVSVFQRCTADFLQQNSEPPYAHYVKERLARYEEAYAIIEKRKLKKILQQVPILWDLKLYFEMHELLELEWKKAEGGRRRALQGLIRAAGMKIHAENNNGKVAVSMGVKALADLMRYRDELADLVPLEVILADIKQTLSTAPKTTEVE